MAAGVWQANPNWTAQEVIEAIRGSGHQAHRPDSLLGYGVPTYSFAVEGKVLSVGDIFEDKIYVYPNPFSGNKLFLKIEL